jgi:carbon monoxide dehydrogenase subunit G
MDITNQFVVPLGPAEAWTVLLDIGRIMPCVPGAELIERLDERTYKGKVSVRLGPVALAFVGTARFEEIDGAAKRAKVLAKGSDAKGRGGASSVVAFRLEPAADGTKVVVETSLTLSGSVAQYGRGTGVIQGVAAQLTAQFAENLKAMLAEDRVGAAAEPASEAVPSPTASGPGAAAEPTMPPAEAASSVSPSDGSAASATARIEAAAARIEAAARRVEDAAAGVEATATALIKAARPPAPALPRAKPISGFSLLLTVLWDMLTGLFSAKKNL